MADANFEATERYFDRITSGNGERRGGPNIAALNQFFALMPKGGDIHHHYSGAIYAETYLDWVEKDGYWINKNSLKIQTARSFPVVEDTWTVKELKADDALYRKLMSLWSDRNYEDYYHDQPPPDLNFFNTFGYFGALANNHVADGLKILKARAKQENVQYLETILTEVSYKCNDSDLNAKLSELQAQLLELQAKKCSLGTASALAACVDVIDKDPNFEYTVDGYTKEVAQTHSGLDDDEFMIRYQTYAFRGAPPSAVFSGLYAGFLAASRSEFVLGVNIVGPENNPIALRDYWLHMQMFSFLGAKFPNVRKSLHAGELALGMVVPEDLTHHITDAVRIAGAERIGHGVAIVHETDSLELLKEMKDKKVTVEINLTSNDFILGISGDAHPVTIYLQSEVPVVISTDDSGVSRNDLASQYTVLGSSYDISYAGIKKLVFNSIRYSFLPEADREKMMSLVDTQFCIFESKIAALRV